MNLSLETIQAITWGAVEVEQVNGAFRFHRFTKEQENFYRETNHVFYKKALAPSGVKLCFETDSPTLFVQMNVYETATTRRLFAVDVEVNGQRIDGLDNYSNVPLIGDYVHAEFPMGEFKKTFQLGEGMKKVAVYMPSFVQAELQVLALEDGAKVLPLKPKKKLLVYGDSITQGYDALNPFNRYSACLARHLDAEEYNKGIGGEKYNPPLAAFSDHFAPDLITVAYGTNDWSCRTPEVFYSNVFTFFSNLRKNYPNTPIYALAPIWRADWQEERDFGPFPLVEQLIRKAADQVENVRVISCFSYVPHDISYYSDLRLHPNDKGFEHYARELIKNF